MLNRFSMNYWIRYRKIIILEFIRVRKYIVCVLILLFSSTLYALPPHDKITLFLTQIEQGDQSCPKSLLNGPVELEYDYDFNHNIGQAYLNRLGSKNWRVSLYPLGLTDYYGFMSDIQPTSIVVEGEEVIIYRIVFLLNKNGQAETLIMFGQEGDCTMSSTAIAIQ